MAKVYQYDILGFYAGVTEDYNGPLPHNCTAVAPPETALGEWEQYKFTKGVWAVSNDYRGANGYVDGAPVTVKTPDLPEGFAFTEPQPTIAERIEAVKQEKDSATTGIVNNILIGEKLAELTGDSAKAEEAKAEFEAMTGVYDELLGLLEEMA